MKYLYLITLIAFLAACGNANTEQPKESADTTAAEMEPKGPSVVGKEVTYSLTAFK